MPDLILASSVTIEVTGPAPVVWEQVEPSPVTVGVGSHLLIPGPPGPHGALTGLNEDDHSAVYVRFTIGASGPAVPRAGDFWMVTP